MSRFAMGAALIGALILPASAHATRTVIEGNGVRATVYDDSNEWLADLGAATGAREGFEDSALIRGLTLEYGGTIAEERVRGTVRFDTQSIGFRLDSFYAFGFDFNEIGAASTPGVNFNWDMVAGGATTGFQSRPSGTQGFFGVIADTPVTAVRLTGRPGFGQRSISLDNFQLYSAASAGVPEPETWALMLLGFGAAGAATRRRARPAFN